MSERLYVVEFRQPDGALLSEQLMAAGSQAQAVRQVVGDRYKARAATAKDVQRIMEARWHQNANAELPLDVSVQYGVGAKS